jgi:hypothetical protein
MMGFVDAGLDFVNEKTLMPSARASSAIISASGLTVEPQWR